MFKVEDLRNQSIEELVLLCEEARAKLFHLINDMKSKKGEYANPHERKHARKDIARLLTVISEKRYQQATR